MALSVGASAPELPLVDLAALLPLQAIEGLDEAFSLPILELPLQSPPLPAALTGLALPATATALTSAVPERWLAMAREQGALQLSAQPLRQVPEALQRSPAVTAPRASNVAPVIETLLPPVPSTPADAVGGRRGAVRAAVAVAVAVPSGSAEPAVGTGALPPAPVSASGPAGTGAAAQLLTPAAPQPVASAPPAPSLEARWGAHMVLALRESVQVQIQQRIQHATIRLDPPHLGSLQVSVSHEAGRVEVHISATQGDTARLLGQAGERLRQELAEQHTGQVSVSVSAEGQGRQPSRQPLWHVEPQVPAAALADADAEAGISARAGQGRDVWVTV